MWKIESKNAYTQGNVNCTVRAAVSGEDCNMKMDLKSGL